MVSVASTTITYPDNTTTFDEVTPDGILLNINYGTPYPPAIAPAGRVRIRFAQANSGVLSTYPLVLREPIPIRLTQASFNWFKIVNELAITTGPYAGSFRYSENNGISWYFDNVGLYHMCSELSLPSLGFVQTDMVGPHINVFVQKLTSSYQIKNLASDLSTLLPQDADDSNAAVFVILVERWLRLTNNWGWLATIHGNTNLPAGQTNQQMLIALMNTNVTSQFKTSAWVAANDPSAVASLMPSVFQGGNNPTGGKFSFGLLEDSAECCKGLRLLGQLLVDVGDVNGPLFLQHGVNLSNVVHGQFNTNTNDWMWNDGQDTQQGTFSVDPSTGFVTVSGFTPTQNMAVMVGAPAGVLPAPLLPNTVYWFLQNGSNWQLSAEFNATGAPSAGGSGAPITFTSAGSGTLHIMPSGASWYPDLQAGIWVELHDVKSTSVIATGTCNIAGSNMTVTAGAGLTSALDGLTVVIGTDSYVITRVNSGTTATVFPNTGSATGQSFNVYGGTVANTLDDQSKFNFIYEKMCKYSPSWWERPGSAAFPDMFAGFYVARYRQDLTKAAAKFNTLAGYYLVPAQPTNGLNNIEEVGFALDLANMLVTPFGTGRNAAYPDTEFQVKKVTSLKRASPPTIVQQVDVGTTISPSSEIVPIQAASTYTVIAVPSIADADDGQILYLVNFGTAPIILQDQGTLAGSNMKLADSVVVINPGNSISLHFLVSQGAWVQDIVPTSLRDFIPIVSAQTVTGASYQIDPKSASLIELTAASAITLTSTPTIKTGEDHQEIELLNVGANTITLQGKTALTGTTLLFQQGALDTITLPPGGSVRLMYRAATSLWYQLGQPTANTLVIPSLVVGAGTLNPLYTLQVNGPAWINNTGFPSLVVGTGTVPSGFLVAITDRLAVSGDTQIGTVTVGADLHVYGAGAFDTGATVGTATPALLAVSGDITVTQKLTVDTQLALPYATAGLALFTDGSSNVLSQQIDLSNSTGTLTNFLEIADGGTGATSIAGAHTNLQTSHTNHVHAFSTPNHFHNVENVQAGSSTIASDPGGSTSGNTGIDV